MGRKSSASSSWSRNVTRVTLKNPQDARTKEGVPRRRAGQRIVWLNRRSWRLSRLTGARPSHLTPSSTPPGRRRHPRGQRHCTYLSLTSASSSSRRRVRPLTTGEASQPRRRPAAQALDKRPVHREAEVQLPEMVGHLPHQTQTATADPIPEIPTTTVALLSGASSAPSHPTAAIRA